MKPKIQKNRLFAFLRHLVCSCIIVLGITTKGFAREEISSDLERTKITLKKSQASLEDLLSSIEKQSGITFVYKATILELPTKVTVDYAEESLKTILQQLSHSFGFSYKQIKNTIALTINPKPAQQQATKISGNVKDKDGTPLMGVNVTEQGTQNGVTTDYDGNFSIEIMSEGVLEFTYLGLQTQTITTSETDNFLKIIMLEDQQMLDEVVVIGYGEKSKETLIDAVSKVDVAAINDRPINNAASALQGLSPGLNITQSSGKSGEAPRINIRGFTSINGGAPLVIVDGVEGDINNVNPNDIAAVSVLKDAGASAIYGARGAFGVVLVTTKKAKTGAITVDFNSSTLMSTPTMNTDFVTDPFQAVSLVDEAFRTAVGRSYTGYNESDYTALEEVSQNPGNARVVTDIRNGKNQYVHYGHTDWWNTFFRKWSPSQIYNVSVSGGSEKLKSYFSYRNYRSTGILKVQEDLYKKYNLRGKLDLEVNDWLSFSNNMQYNSSSDVEHGGSQYGWGTIWGSLIWVHALPSYVPTNPDGNALWRTELNNYTIGDGVYASLLHGKSKQITDASEFSNIVSMKLEPFPGLDINASYAIRRLNYNRLQRSTRIPYSIFVGEVGQLGSDGLTEYNTRSNYDALNIYADYSRTFDEHSLNAMIGFNQETYLQKNIQASKQNSISDDLNSLGLGTSNAEATGSASEWAIQGLFYRLSYDYKDKYLIELNGRYDGSSRFPSDYRWGFFPSVSAGWLVNKEGFFQSLENAVDLFKLRVSYGSLGNQNIGDYAYIPTLNKDIDNSYALDGRTLDYVVSPSLNPKEITWEKVNTLNVGTDLSFLNSKFTVSFDWFQRDTEGMLTKGATLPSVLGTQSPQENAADLRTRGFELALGHKNSFELAGSSFRYSIAGNLSNSKSKITRFDNPNNSLLDYYEGMTIGELWGYTIEGLFESEAEIADHADQSRVSSRILSIGGLQPGDVKYSDLNNDGKVDEGENTLDSPGDRSIIGNTAPQYLYSFKLDAAWKGFDVSAFFQGVGKQNWYPNNDSRIFWAMYNRPYDSFIRKDLANNIWTPENPDALYPRLVGYIALSGGNSLNEVNNRYLQDVAYLRLKNLTFGYSLPQTLTEKLPISKFRIYFSGENLLTFSKLTDYIDPEAASNSVNLNLPSASTNRSTAQTVPFSKVYSLGVSIKF